MSNDVGRVGRAMMRAAHPCFSVRPRRYHSRVTTLVRPDQPEDDLDRLRARMPSSRRCSTPARRRRPHRARSGHVRGPMPAAGRHAARAARSARARHREAELGELSKQVADGPRAGLHAAAVDGRAGDAPRFTSDAVRKLFRDVARTIHPDLAGDEHTRDRRRAHDQANRPTRCATRNSSGGSSSRGAQPGSGPGSDPAATRLRRAPSRQIEEHLTRAPAISSPCRPRGCSS